MTDHDICEKQRANGNSELYLLLRGSFWRAYDGAAFAVARVMKDYQIKRLKTIDRYQLGFPTTALQRVLSRMKEMGMEVLPYTQDATLITFRGGDPTVDASMVMKPEATDRIVDTTADYRELCSLRKELLAFDLTDPTHTRITLLAYIRDLQLRCLSHLPLDW